MKKGHILKNGFVLKHKTKNGGLTKPHKTKKGKRVVLIKVCQWSSFKKAKQIQGQISANQKGSVVTLRGHGFLLLIKHTQLSNKYFELTVFCTEFYTHDMRCKLISLRVEKLFSID